jgi:two-component system sensor histidine kinase DctS
LAFILFVGGVALLLWMSDRADKEERRATLISDILWLEQNLRFHLTATRNFSDASTLAQTGSAASFEVLCPHVFGFESGLRQLIWLGMTSGQAGAHPAAMDPSVVG